jgi:predicted small secreted protein
MMKRLLHLLVFLIALFLLAGCSPGTGDTEDILKAEIEKDPEFEMLDDGVEIKMPVSGDRLILGATEDFYSAFPETVPLIPGAVPNNRLILPEGPETFTFTTLEPWSQVQEFYLETSHYSENGWEIIRQEHNEQAVNLKIHKGNHVVIISATRLRSATGADIGYAVRER